MTRALSLHLPWWSTELVRRRLLRRTPSASPADNPTPPFAILLVATLSQRRVIASCCPSAIRQGVAPGMTLAHARALLPPHTVHIEDHDPARDHASLSRLAMWAHRFSPIAAPDPPDGLLLDITGCARTFRGEGRLLRKVLSGAQWLGFTARGAISPTFGSAWALARFADRIESRQGVIIDAACARDALTPLPLAALRICPQTAAALTELGAHTIGDLLALPRTSLPARFGSELLHRLDQALGQAMERIEPVHPVPPPQVERLFEGATTRTDAIEACTHQLLGELSTLLAPKECGIRSLRVELGRVDSVPVEIDITLSRPSRDAKHLWTLVRPPLERANLGYGVERITLTALRIGRVKHTQAQHWPDANITARTTLHADAAALIDLLTNRLGPDRVTRITLRSTHIPERATQHRPAIHTDDAACRKPDLDQFAAIPTCHPPTLFERPEPAEAIAMVPDAPPSRLRWRGNDLTITLGQGPERIEPEWWAERSGPQHDKNTSHPTAARDYYRVREQGGAWLWVYRELNTTRWFVHGMWA